MSDDHDIGAFEHTIERRDELLFSRSIHCKLFPVGGPSSIGGTRRLRPAVLPALGRTTLLVILPPKYGSRRTGFPRVRTGRGASGPKKRSSPSVQAFELSLEPQREARAPAVSDRTGFRKLPEALGAKRKTAIGSAPLQIDPAGCLKGIRSQPPCFLRSAQKRADTPGRHALGDYVKAGTGFAKREIKQFFLDGGTRSRPEACADRPKVRPGPTKVHPKINQVQLRTPGQASRPASC
jgi:hypothetical protein